ncbi:hypothetical protein HFP51_02260 [Parasphingopyxis sp. CP4]|uniref:M56 family metallopeptidase n=1 Tax=Parasphingopyxis sp. CP4 TaxID=2724527 RepID=UPI0015A38AF4|nr:M56 family metallopeptidase [Parasphingopyxis sp. CP4]QLC21112.1 hypothetical protein HFP51_02260 [Parasphingopyxis sp. CP4]
MAVNPSVLVDSLGWALLHSLWQITLVAALVYGLLRIIPRHSAQLRFVTAFGGLAASLLFFIATWIICYRTIGAAQTVTLAHIPPAQGWQAVVETLGRTTWLVSLAWGLGFTWLGVRYVQSLRATSRLRRIGTGPVPTDWELRFRLWVERLGADPRAIILQSSRITTPLTIGALKPIVLVPTGFFLRLPIDQAEAILVHEIAHICRQDYLLGLVQAMICNIFFFHPAIAFLSRQIDIEREYACDARVVAETGNSTALAQGLGKVALESADMLPGFAMAADGKRTPLMNRITRLRERPFRRESGSTMPAAGLTLLLAGCLTIAASADASFSSTNFEEDKGKNRESASDAAAEPEAEATVAAPVETAEATSRPAPRAVRNAERSEPKSREDRWSEHRSERSMERRSERRTPSNRNNWTFDIEPGSWAYDFERTDRNGSKRARPAPRLTAAAEPAGLLRSAVFEIDTIEPVSISENEGCDDKGADAAAIEFDREQERIEREQERAEARYDREEVRIERSLNRELANLNRQHANEESRIAREISTLEERIQQVAQSLETQSPDELQRLTTRMTSLAVQMESLVMRYAERAAVIEHRAESRIERLRHRESPAPRAPRPPIAHESPEPPIPTITISFRIELDEPQADLVAAVPNIILASAPTS